MSLNFITSKYRILGKKGEGTFSDVMKCQNTSDGSFAACKKMKQHYESLEQVNNLREIQAMRRLAGHPNILELVEVMFDKKSGTLVLICELMDMNIYELIRGRRHYLPDHKIKSYMYQLCKSIDHMHRSGIFHRDVKPENILIKDDLLKLADFGSCRSVYSKQPYTEYISTRWYRAPECLLTDGYYTHKMDIWSVGCVMFEILSLHPLFPGSNEVDQIAKIHDVMGTPEPKIIAKLRNKTRGMNFDFPSKKGTGIEKMLPHVSSEGIDLIYQLCRYDPEERLSSKQALRHTYFKDLRDQEKRAAQLMKMKKEKEKQERERKEKEEAENYKGVESEKNKENTEPETVESITEQHKKKLIKKDRSKERENNLREISNKYKLDPIEKFNKENEEEEKKKPKKSKSPSRPDSGNSSMNHSSVRYPGSILHNRDPVYGYRRKAEREKLNIATGDAYMAPYVPQLSTQRNYFEKKKIDYVDFELYKRRKSRLSESSPVHNNSSFLPKVSSTQKPSTFQPTFTSTYGASQIPKLGATSTYLPHLTHTQAFMAKPTKTKPQATKRSIYGHYQLPQIQKRAGNY